MLGQSVQRVVRGLDAALMVHRGRSRCWQLGRVESGEQATESCLSTADQVDVRGNRALAHTKSSERIGDARALSCP